MPGKHEKPSKARFRQLRSIDECCDLYERALQKGENPNLGDCLKACPGVDETELIRELLTVYVQFHLHRGEPLIVERIEQQTPRKYKSLVRDVVGQQGEKSTGTVRYGDALASPSQPASEDPLPTANHDADADADDPDATTAPSGLGEEPLATIDPSTVSVRCPECRTEFEARLSGNNIALCPQCKFTCQYDAESSSSDEPDRVGKFELERVLGRGAFGVVYLAHDTELQRKVALKFPRKGTFSSRDEEDRFLREARHTASLRHPGLVPVYEAGRTSRGPYIASEFVEGTTLAEELIRRDYDFGQAALLILELAEALQHAHSQGVVHRDLKPSNIMLDRSAPGTGSSHGSYAMTNRSGSDRESRSRSLPKLDAVPRILDFGLARRDEGEQVVVTLDGQIVGTPAYMSPEQAKGQGNQADRRSDIYSLGVMLFELLTGERPFRGNVRMLLKQVAEDDPPKPRKLNGQIPRDLETICLKCLEKEGEKRYQEARDLADDLKRFLEDIPILARPVSTVEYAWRWCRRNTDLVYPVAGMSALIVIVTVAAFVLITLSRNAERIAKEKNLELYEVAEAGRHTARETINVYLTGLSENLKYYPGMQGDRLLLLENAVERYEELIEDRSEDPQLEVERGQSLIRLADALAVIGKVKESRERCHQAIEVFENALATPGLEDPCRIGLAKARMGLASALSKTRDSGVGSQEIDSIYQQAIDELKSRHVAEDWQLSAYEALFAAMLNRALYLEQIDRLDDAEQQLRQLEHRADEALAAWSSQELTSIVIAARAALGSIHWKRGQLSSAEDKLSQALQISNTLVDNAKDRIDALNQRASIRIHLARVFLAQGDEFSEEDAYLKALSDYEALLDIMYDSPVFLENASMARADYGRLLTRQMRHQEAEPQLVTALEGFLKLTDMAPHMAPYYENAATCKDMLADLYLDLSWVAEASAECDESLSVLAELVREFPAVLQYRQRWAICLARRGRVQYYANDPDKGSEDFVNAIRDLSEIAQKSESVEEYRYSLCKVHSHYLECLDAVDDDARINVSREAAKAWHRLGEQTDSPMYLLDAAWFFLTASEPAVRDLELVAKYAQSAKEKFPQSADAHLILGAAKIAEGEPDAGIRSIEKAAQLRTAADGRDLIFLALAQHKSGHADKATEMHGHAVEWVKSNVPGRWELIRLMAEVEQQLTPVEATGD